MSTARPISSTCRGSGPRIHSFFVRGFLHYVALSVCPETRYVDQAGCELSEICLPLLLGMLGLKGCAALPRPPGNHS